QKFVLAIEFPPGKIHVHSAYAVVVMRRHSFQLWEVSAAVAADGIHQIAANNSRGIRQTIRKQGGSGIQQKPGGLAGAGCDDESSRMDASFFARRLIDVRYGCNFAILANH